MSENQKKQPNPDGEGKVTTDVSNRNTEYEHGLRAEAKKYRLEKENAENELKAYKVTTSVKEALNARGLNIDPNWLSVKPVEGTDLNKTIDESINDLISKYPQLENNKNVKNTQKPLNTEKKNTNINTPNDNDWGVYDNDKAERSKFNDNVRSLL